MYIKKKINRSGSVSVVVAEKNKGKYKGYLTIGIGNSDTEVTALVSQGKEWSKAHQLKSQPELDLYGDERAACE